MENSLSVMNVLIKAVLQLTIGYAPTRHRECALDGGLTRVLDESEKNKNCKLVILTGEGNIFVMVPVWKSMPRRK